MARHEDHDHGAHADPHPTPHDPHTPSGHAHGLRSIQQAQGAVREAGEAAPIHGHTAAATIDGGRMRDFWSAGKAIAALIAVLLGGCATASSAGSPASAPPRVILIIGDGVGLSQWSALRLSDDAPLAVTRLPEIGLVDTRCDCERTTDSAAGATAYAIGERTGYLMVGVGTDSLPRTTVLEAAQARGLATGMVTTTHITDATPAAFG
ncbi:MAG TPA: alkaline phosphatase, partial [Longimicrobiales bacterium]|nr:alkaline phosphatase [Longimicrobiales bacterium]